MNQLFEKIRFYANDWPDGVHLKKPGDLSMYAHIDSGFYHSKEAYQPIATVPKFWPSWGFAYFENDITKEDFVAFLKVLGFHHKHKDCYAAFLSESNDISGDGYFRQMKLVGRFALSSTFSVINRGEYEAFEPQELDMVDALWAFIESENERVDSGELEISCTLTNEDDDEANEALCFGFLAENSEQGICRIWSRAWVVRK
jgi:hypothetical protein